MSEERLRLLEHKQISFEATMAYMTEILDEIRESIKDALNIKGKVEDHNGQIKKLWDKYDLDVLALAGIAIRVQELEHWRGVFDVERIARIARLETVETTLATIKMSHEACQETQRERRSARARITDGIVEKLIWAAGCAIFATVVTMATKGYFK